MGIKNIESLGLDLRNLLMNQAEEAYRDSANETFYNVVKETNVDSGTLRGNWIVGVNVDSKTFVSTKQDISGNTVITEAKSKIDTAKLTDKIIFNNNTPYANIIEEGDENHTPQLFTKVGIDKTKENIRGNK